MFLFLFFTLANIGFPGTSSFVGEFLILLGSFNVNIPITILSSISMILGGCYSLWLFNRVAYGNLKVQYLNNFFFDLSNREVYYLSPDMAEAHDALICIGEKKFVDDQKRFRFSNQHYFKKSNDLKELYKDIPEALENNYNFPQRFSFKPKKSKPILPSISNNEDISAETELMNQSYVHENMHSKPKQTKLS